MSTAIERFVDELERVAGKAQHVASPEEAINSLLECLRAKSVQILALEDFPLGRELNLKHILQDAGFAMVGEREIARANVGISGVQLAVAETGSLLVGGGIGDWELVTALPPVHIALLRESQIIATLEEAFAFCEQQLAQGSQNFLFVTGPSRTADIELTPVIGVHGPQELIALILP